MGRNRKLKHDKMVKPIIFNPEIEKINIETIKRKLKIERIIDTYRQQLEELFLIRNPFYKFNKNSQKYQKEFKVFISEHSEGKKLENCGRWIYFPWSRILVHCLQEELYLELRTSRNRNLITGEEQKKFYEANIAIAGLSVGSNAAITIALMGGGKKMKLADPDILMPSNLNRMRFDLTNIGMNKAELVAQYIYQVNPYAELCIYSGGLNKKSIPEFLKDVDILIEEIDDIETKIELRKEARKRKIPVIMATDNADNVFVDIERFDLNPRQPVLYGKLEGLNIKEVKKSPKKLFEAMSKIIDMDLVPSRMTESVLEVGRKLYSWPQLATAASLSGAVIAYIVRKIILEERIRDGRIEINLDATFSYPEDYKKELKKRKELNKKFFSILEKML